MLARNLFGLGFYRLQQTVIMFMCVKAVSYVACRTKNNVLYNVFQLGYQFLQLRPIVNLSVVTEVQELSEPKFE